MTTTETFKMAVVEKAATEIWWDLTHGKNKTLSPESLISKARSVLDAAEQACKDMDNGK